MPMQDAIQLVSDIEINKTLRNTMYTFGEPSEVYAFLNQQGYYFTPDEFEDAINSLHVKCAQLEDAQDLMYKAEFLRLVLNL